MHRGAQEKRERMASVRASQGIEVQPNNAAPLLRDEKARREWVDQELDMACQVRFSPFFLTRLHKFSSLGERTFGAKAES